MLCIFDVCFCICFVYYFVHLRHIVVIWYVVYRWPLLELMKQHHGVLFFTEFRNAINNLNLRRAWQNHRDVHGVATFGRNPRYLLKELITWWWNLKHSIKKKNKIDFWMRTIEAKHLINWLTAFFYCSGKFWKKETIYPLQISTLSLNILAYCNLPMTYETTHSADSEIRTHDGAL